MAHIDETSLAYVAGIVDGEGCIAIRRARPSGSRRTESYSAMVTIGNTSRRLIEHLVRLYGFGCVTYRAPTKSRRASFLWTVESRHARDLVVQLLPYLVVKRRQAEVLRKFMDEFDSFKGARLGHKGGTRVSDVEMQRRRALHDEMRDLNRVGPRDSDPRLADGRRSKGITAEFFAQVNAQESLDLN